MSPARRLALILAVMALGAGLVLAFARGDLGPLIIGSAFAWAVIHTP